jgi:hypothetical protein
MVAPKCRHEIRVTASLPVKDAIADLPPEPPSREITMNWTDYAGLAGLVAAAVLAGWTLLGTNTTTPHRGTPRHSGNPAASRPIAGRHRAPAHRLLARLRLR